MNQFFQQAINVLLTLNHQLTPQGCIALLFFLVMILFVLKLRKPEKDATPVGKPANSDSYFADQDIKAIAGDDEITTQLDLARAFIEMGQEDPASEILQNVLKMGSESQQQAAKKLLASLSCASPSE